MTVDENVVAMPAPTSSSRGNPSLPKMRHQAASALTTKPMTQAHSPQIGRSMAAMKERSTM